MAKPLPDQEFLRDVLDYNADTGFLFWKDTEEVRRTPARVVGAQAFQAKTAKGYYRGGLFGRNVMAHRVVWKWHHGTEPPEIDHIDGNPSNNKIDNLRAATRQENVRNTRIRKNNKSGTQGVYWHSQKGRWVANIRDGGRQLELGCFVEKAEAIRARREAELRLDYHPNHGRK